MSSPAPASPPANLDWLKWTSISLVIAVSACGVVALIVYVLRRREYGREYAREQAAHEAERQRLMQLMYHLHLSVRRPKAATNSIWAFQPNPGLPLCSHGLSKPPGEFQTGYRQAFMDVCPVCFPDCSLSVQDEVPDDVVRIMMHHPVPYYEQPQQHISPTPVKLRKATSREIPNSKSTVARKEHNFLCQYLRPPLQKGFELFPWF
eukprot:Gregarina_sp_Poly_1__4295@NODE_2334_length_2280_cov_11_353818_g1491_i0_p1_GENE_NODE_2334_length_2280_cov_11_353818_g1491_i0NODE_2334_length_2280_cov_11_353818_g1491_i0_p1_ORF_typecomplete_len206_score10_62DUF4381/PF14316_6/0_036Pan3_PK/PF18101_1/0_11COX6A/PF02046_15/1_6COX6A/PF02046_15/1e02_NODE_2334_length_2280_cov_11_353818_g1491_i084701